MNDKTLPQIQLKEEQIFCIKWEVSAETLDKHFDSQITLL